ncbi:reverse transcriptase domain-containing protein [Paenibacillus agricola]|uniref:reverse transcriptase domain-containing protein n=1 Tax=Paenibacillus agricola TaxID=2716264 RepID=UPI001A9F1818|nr:reverse transcriptase domain-containing protein [Paenibacillus agricola]
MFNILVFVRVIRYYPIVCEISINQPRHTGCLDPNGVTHRRYADDAVIHCHSKMAAEQLKAELEERLRECGLELHPVKTRIVYCKDDNRRLDHSEIAFDFLGYTFRPRRAKNREGTYFISFIPGASKIQQRRP